MYVLKEECEYSSPSLSKAQAIETNKSIPLSSRHFRLQLDTWLDSLVTFLDLRVRVSDE